MMGSRAEALIYVWQCETQESCAISMESNMTKPQASSMQTTDRAVLATQN